MRTVDLNADFGEGFGRYRLSGEDEVLDLASSVSIACGFHGGDPGVMRRTVAQAARRGVTIGAHPGYRDPQGFGRRELGASPEEIEDDTLYQVGALRAFCGAASTRLRYVKPHGALYLRAARDPAAADAIARAMSALDPALVLLGSGELLAAARRAGLPTADEAFVDRAYRPDGTLIPRSEPGAVLRDPVLCAERAARMVLEGFVEAIDGTRLTVQPDSLCVHGDGPTAVELLTAVRQRLESAGVRIVPFAR